MKEARRLPHRHAFRVLFPAATAILLTLMAFTLFADRANIVSLVSDDAYYYFKVAQNLALDGTSSFDRVTHTTGYHPLYAWLLTACIVILNPGVDALVHLALFGNVLLMVLTAYFLFRAGALVSGRMTGLWACLLFLVNPYTALWPLTGMEASLNACLVAALFTLLLAYLADAPPLPRCATGFRLSILGLVAGLAVLARIDNYIIAGLACLVVFVGRPCSLTRRTTEAALVMLIPSIFLLMWFGYCHHVSGDWLQGSARMKSLFRQMETEGFSTMQVASYSIHLFGDFVVSSILKVPALKYIVLFGGPVALLWKRTTIRPTRIVLSMFLAIPCVLACGYAAKLPKVHTWYFVPAVLSLTLVTAHFVSGLSRSRLFRKRTWILTVFSVLVVLEAGVGLSMKLVRGRNKGQRDMLAVAEMLGHDVPQGSKIGAWNAGIYGYYSGMTVINLDGLINDEIFGYVNEGKVNWPYWLDRHIDYLVDSDPFFKGLNLQYNGAELHKVREFKPQYGKNPIVLYRLTRTQ